MLDWELVPQLEMGSVRASDWALELLLAMGLAPMSLVPELAMGLALAWVKELVEVSEAP